MLINNLSKIKSLKVLYLNLSQNDIDKDRVEYLSKFLPKLDYLDSLDIILDNNKIDEDNEFSGPDVISKPDKVELKPVGDVENVKNSPITEKMPIPTKIFKRIDIHEPKTPNKPVKFRPETYKAPRKVTVKEAVVIKTPGDKEVVVKASMSGTYVELGTVKSAAD